MHAHVYMHEVVLACFCAMLMRLCVYVLPVWLYSMKAVVLTVHMSETLEDSIVLLLNNYK